MTTLELWPEDADLTWMLTVAVHSHFSHKAEQTRKALKHLLMCLYQRLSGAHIQAIQGK